jgi:FixJ family two-component response regulator
LSHICTIAVVDDDEAVRTATSSLVRSLGYNVAAFESAEAFLASDMTKRYGCLVSDVRMRGMSGIELRAELLRCGSSLPVIFITAFASEPIRKMAKSGDIAGLLEKPYDGCELGRLLMDIVPAP